MLLISLIALFLLLLFAQYSYRKNQDIRTKFKLFALRDKLRMAAIKKEINQEHRLFKYLDTSISKNVKHISQINLWLIILFYFSNRRKVEYKTIRDEFLRELFLPENHNYRILCDELIDIIISHLKTQHYIIQIALISLVKSIQMFKPVISFFTKVVNGYITSKQSSTINIYYSPAESSTKA